MSDDAAERIRITRAREVERATTGRVGRLAPSFDTTVVGVTFTPGYPQNLHDLEGLQFEAAIAGESLVCVIVRNPDNPYDSNACEVHVPALGEQGMVGHLTRPVAQRLAAELDAGQPWQGHVLFVKIHDEHQDRPGLEIHLERQHHG
jgi:hypothetical protein